MNMSVLLWGYLALVVAGIRLRRRRRAAAA
jgi:hypothetical protein